MFERGGEATSSLNEMLRQHRPALKLLCGGMTNLVRSLPSVDVNDLPLDESIIRRFRELDAKVNEMGTQRKMLLAKLKDQVSGSWAVAVSFSSTVKIILK